MKIQTLLISILLLVIFGCKKSSREVEPPVEEPKYNSFAFGEFALGADLSYVNEIEDHGGVFRDSSKIRDPYQILKNHGANLVRLRLWHNPVWVRNVYGNQQKTLYSGYADVEKSIRRAKSLGLAVLLDFHYSDTWADPGKQKPPVAWENITSLQVLKDSVYKYTYSVLTRLNDKGLMPEMVQIGNETNCGMLISGVKAGFPKLDGCNNYWQDLGAVINSGIAAVRDVSAKSTVKTKIALHVADPKNLDWWFGKITSSGAVNDFDIMGMSYYPLWHTTVSFDNLPALIIDLKGKYKKQVMILETAYPWTTDYADSYSNLFGSQSPLAAYPFSKEGQYKFMVDLCQRTLKAGGSGVIYWEPAYISSQAKTEWGTGSPWENCTLFDFSGNALSSIDYLRYPYSIY